MKIAVSLNEKILEYSRILDRNIAASDHLNSLFAKKVPYSGKPAAKQLDPLTYSKNPYFSLIKGLRFEQGHSRLKEGTYQKKELFLADETYGDPKDHYLEVNPLGYFAEPFPFPELQKKAETWMSLIPHEMASMTAPIASAHGKVLTLGLGLGYFAFMVSEKAEVTSVDVIENDPEIIAIFNEKLLPLFPHKSKIHILEEDALLFAAKRHPVYDTVFVDLYHTEEDGLPLYLALKPLQKNLLAPKGHCDYWIERSLLAGLRRYAIALLDEERQGSSDEDYPASDDPEAEIFRKLHFAAKKVVLSTSSDLDLFLSDQSLSQIVG